MKREEKSIFDRATHLLRMDVPDDEAITASAARTAKSLGIAINQEALMGTIQNCDGVQKLLGLYRAGTLPEARALLVQAHLRDCGLCQRLFREGPVGGPLDWSAPSVAAATRKSRLAWSLAFAISAAVLISAMVAYRLYWQVPPGVRAEVQSIDGSAYLITGSGNRRVATGAELREGEELRTTGESRAVLRLSDGSIMEVNQRSALGVGARGHDMTVTLSQGAVIVQAARRTSGHLYVGTPDCRVAVTGTIFSVDAGIKGSRVAVLQGSVKVAHGGIHATLRPGDQMATNDNLAPEPLDQQFAWSPEREKYVGLMAQLANVEHRIAQIPFPQPRYSSDLLARMPADTLLYISIPNLGDFLQQADGIFHDQLNQSPELQQWWARTQRNPQALDDLVGKIHDVSQYLGDEVIVVATGQRDRASAAVIADVQKSGLKDELQKEFASSGGGLVVLDPSTLAAGVTATAGPAGYALVRDHEVVFSKDIATLSQLNTQLDRGTTGFADGDFGKQISAAYDRGAGIILAANLHAMLMNKLQRADQGAAKQSAVESSGLGAVQYLIAEHRETNGMPANHLNLQFAGRRQRLASWLASPAPIGSLDFVSPNAAVAVATLTKDPSSIADDLMEMASGTKGTMADWSEIDSKLQISVRDDLMANLGGDFLLALDGPVLPTPSWKMVIEVNNPNALEGALERVVQAMRSQPQGAHARVLSIEPSMLDSQRYYAVRDLTSGATIAQYTFADGFMILGPDRALLTEALKTHASGNSLARSAAFRSLLPRDENENYSAVAYQNLSPVLTPLLSQFSGESAEAIRKLAADSRPTVICAWGKDNRIEAASDSRLFGFDFLTLGSLLNSRNKSAGQNVIQ